MKYIFILQRSTSFDTLKKVKKGNNLLNLQIIKFQLTDADNRKDDHDNKLDGNDDKKRNIDTSKNKYDNSINEPKIVADKVEDNVVSKANLGFYSTFILAILGGSFISLAAIFFTFHYKSDYL